VAIAQPDRLLVPTDNVADEAARTVLDDEPGRNLDRGVARRLTSAGQLVEDVALVGHRTSSVTREPKPVR
jgi:hypothetical protein